ncbi:MAG: patatin-like phospholipase family protein [Verrucomicrobiales bacterium]|nr:patatin-like phospholipase family protein [Verrucomicrobiales bacterium]
MKIGISLSGGGVRATVFHLGVLKRLAESGRWHEIAHVSTVSGGSLCAALIFAKNRGAWPDGDRFLHETLALCQRQLTKNSLVTDSLTKGLFFPHLLAGGRAHLVGRVLRSAWDLEMSLRDLPETPRWTINSTTYETGKNWRFSHKRMGDYLTGYVLNPDFPVADAAASSAGFPGGIGPLKLETNRWEWVNFIPGSQSKTQPVQPLHRHYHLWDGGVYENLGSEALIKPGKGLRDDIDFYIASDAGRPMQHEFLRWALRFPPYRPPLRLLDCAMDQIRAVRARSIHGFLRGAGRGKCVYLQIGLPQSAIFREAGSPMVDDAKDEGVATFSASFPTTLRRLSEVEYGMLFEHGYRVADATLAAWVQGEF